MDTPNILVVEDNPDIRLMLRCLFEMEGFKVLSAGNGIEALAALRGSDRPCLIFLDLIMPVMDGWAFLEVLHQASTSRLASLPVTVVSGVGDIQEARGLEKRYGCNVLKKPANADVLLKVARQHCLSAG